MPFEAIFDFLSNNTLSRAELSTEGKIMNIHYGDVLIKYESTLDAQNTKIPFISTTSQEHWKNDFLCDGDIIIADTAEDETVGKVTEIYNIMDSKIVSGLHTIPCRAKVHFSLCYLGFYMNSEAYHRQLYSLMQGIKVFSISKANISKTRIRFPSIPNQEKIVSLLIRIDKKIQLQQELIVALKSYKRGVITQYFQRRMSLLNPTEKWTKCQLKDCLNYEQPQKYIVHSEHYSTNYSTPVLTANKASVLGYTNEADGIYDKGQVIIYDDFTMEIKFVEFPFKVKSSTIKMLTANIGYNLYFLFCLLQSLQLKPEGHQRSYISIIEPMEVFVPSIQEQNFAADLLYSMNCRLECEEKRLLLLERQKAGLLQQLFI